MSEFDINSKEWPTGDGSVEVASYEQSNVESSSVVLDKLDALLSQTQLYSEFLLDKMGNIAFSQEDDVTSEKCARKVELPLQPASNANVIGTSGQCSDFEELMEPETDIEEQEDYSDNSAEQETTTIEQKEIIPLLTGGTLKSYQLKGVKWLISLWQNGLNGILADEMGLGKTVQAVGILAHLKGKGMHGPFLVCAPLSTLSNWVNEIKRWVPSLPVMLYHGLKGERGELRRTMPSIISPAFPVLVTSFEVAIRDRRFLSRRKWKYVIVDEGHRLKNFNCKLIRELKMIPTENSLLLTGTPLQNNLSELWSLLNFILPEVFSSLQQFESWFDFSGKQAFGADKEEVDEHRRLEVIRKLHKILRPFLLRRLKDEVEQTLPLKKEIIFYAPMSLEQQKLQQHLVNDTLNEHFAAKFEGVCLQKRLNNVVMQLRKNANHPDLLHTHLNCSVNRSTVHDLLELSGKLKLLERLLTYLKATGHKVLLFSQMTRMLDILEYYLQERGMHPCRIDGRVKLKDREEQIQDFNDERKNRFIFLLSTRAGGLGINLTAADTVIIYDSDWNPHMDLQAMDRCHRIGQEKPVHVYRLVTANSIECKMIKVGICKMQLERVVIEKGHFKQERHLPKAKLEENELLTLLRQERDVEEEDVQQSVISDANLLRALDRTDLYRGLRMPCHKLGSALPEKGPGWEVVTRGSSAQSILSSIDNKLV